jgi:hypothetical protein
LDVLNDRQQALLKNQHNIHQKLQLEKDFEEVEAFQPLEDPFATLTLEEMTYIEIIAPRTMRRRSRRSSST